MRQKNKRLGRGAAAFLLCVLLIACSFLVPAVAADNGFSISVGSIENGGLVRVHIFADESRRFGGFSLKLRYTDALLRFQSAQGFAHNGVVTAGLEKEGVVSVAFATASDTGYTGGDPACEIVFQIADGAVGTAELSLLVAEAIDTANAPLTGLGADPVTLEVTPLSVEITTPPLRKFYFCGEPLDLSGLAVTATFPGGVQAVLTEYAVRGFQSAVPGETVVTVRSGKNEAAFSVLIVLKGDVDANELVNTEDRALILQQAADRAALSEEQQFRMDLNGDGVVDGFDVLYENRYIQENA